MNVFYDAGLLFESNLVSGTNYRKGETLTHRCDIVGPLTMHYVFRVTFSSVPTIFLLYNQ